MIKEIQFEVGEKYENMKGIFEVLAIKGDLMDIRWVTGEEITTPIALQQRILERMHHEKELAKLKAFQAAKKAKVHVAIGVNERNREASNASLYNTLLYIDASGKILGKHRKLIPTGGERSVWARGDGSTLAAYETPLGVLGGLLCWENYMPLARNAMYA